MENNIYMKVQVVKEKLLKENIKKSGSNKFAGYEYYELGDFVPYIIKFCNEEKLFTSFSFDNELARLTIINCDKPSEVLEYTSPMKELQLKGCNEIQGLGGVETYSRRYLYMNAFDIVENDMFDGVTGKDEKKTIELISEEQKKYATNLAKKDVEKAKQVMAKLKVSKISDMTKSQAVKFINEMKGEASEDNK
jgi:hypothetical protein